MAACLIGMFLTTLTQDVAGRNVRFCGFITCCSSFFDALPGGQGWWWWVRMCWGTVAAVFMWCDSVRFEETCSRAPKIFWQAELNVNAPWSWIVQTSFHRNDLYAAGTRADEMPFSSVLNSSGVQQATSALQIACIKCLLCCPQPQLAVTKCRSRALDTSECHLFILTAVEGNNGAGNSLNEMKSGRREQAGTYGRRWGTLALSSRRLSALSYSFYSPGGFCCRWELHLWKPSRVCCFQSALKA